MARTRRKSGLNGNYFSGWHSLKHAYNHYYNRRARYRQSAMQWDVSGSHFINRRANQTDEELLAEARDSYERQFRDGRGGLTCTTINTGFKKGAAKMTRRANKRFCKMVVEDDPRWEDTAYPNGHEGDHHIWDWW